MDSASSREEARSQGLGLENFRDKFTELYKDRSNTLEDIMHIMETVHQVKAR